jgi:hypothetical protein
MREKEGSYFHATLQFRCVTGLSLVDIRYVSHLNRTLPLLFYFSS